MQMCVLYSFIISNKLSSRAFRYMLYIYEYIYTWRLFLQKGENPLARSINFFGNNTRISLRTLWNVIFWRNYLPKPVYLAVSTKKYKKIEIPFVLNRWHWLAGPTHLKEFDKIVCGSYWWALIRDKQQTAVQSCYILFLSYLAYFFLLS